MKVGFAQFKPKFGDKEYNLGKISDLARQAKAELLVFPEMCTTGYVVKNKAELKGLAESIPGGPTVKQLSKISKETGTTLIVGMPELQSKKVFNSVVVISPQGYITRNQKSHLFFEEFKYFEPGVNKPVIFKWRGFKIGLGICYDYMFPEYWRTLALQGADLFCNSANFIYNYGFKMMQARSLENGVFGICADRIGMERGVKFRGGSEIVDNRGEVVKKAGIGEKIYVADLDLKKSRDKKWNPYNDVLKDRRPELYGG